MSDGCESCCVSAVEVSGSQTSRMLECPVLVHPTPLRVLLSSVPGPMKNRPPRRSILAWLRRPFIPVFWEIPRDGTALERASVIFLQGGELRELPKVLEWLGRSPLAGVPVVLHIDLLAGLANDEAGLRYVASLEGISGIITVRHHLVSPARRLGLACIVRLFLHDTRAVDRGLQIVESCPARRDRTFARRGGDRGGRPVPRHRPPADRRRPCPHSAVGPAASCSPAIRRSAPATRISGV